MTTVRLLPVVVLNLNGCTARLDNRHIILFGDRGNKLRGYTLHYPEGIPEDTDESSFAELYRAFRGLRKEGLVRGPFSDNKILTYDFFRYFLQVPPTSFLVRLEKLGIPARVVRIIDNGDEESIQEAIKIFDPWMKGGTPVSTGSLQEELVYAQKREEIRKREKTTFIGKLRDKLILFLLSTKKEVEIPAEPTTLPPEPDP